MWQLSQLLLLIGLLLYIGGVLIGLLPFVLLAVVVVIAVCSFYALLPESFRLPMLEIWLDQDWQPPSSRPQFTSSYPSSFTDSSSNTNKEMNRDKFHQPSLDFEKVGVNAATKRQLPNREELITLLKSKIIGQDKAIEVLVRVVLGKLAAKNYPKPLVIFLAGTTGTGKTELSKSLADVLRVILIRFDMGEYKEGFKASKLMGSSEGYVGSDKGGALPNALRQSKKYCILLFDEVDKADPDIWRQLLAFFDEGRITDTLGTVIAPKNTICLLTSNLAAEKIAQNPEGVKDILRDAKFFPPEFIGRIDKIIALPKLSKVDSARLTVILAKKVAERYGITLVIEQEALGELVQETFEEGEKYGGRGIQEKILDLLSDDLIDLQGCGYDQARVIVQNGVLRAVWLD